MVGGEGGILCSTSFWVTLRSQDIQNQFLYWKYLLSVVRFWGKNGLLINWCIFWINIAFAPKLPQFWRYLVLIIVSRLCHQHYYASTTYLQTKCLEELDARNTTLNEQYMPILSKALRLSTQLHVLKLENCNLSGRPLVILGKYSTNK